MKHNSNIGIVALLKGGFAKVECLSENLFRVRYERTEAFKEPSMIKYGILKNTWAKTDLSVKELDNKIIFSADKSKLVLEKENGRIYFYDDKGKLLTQNATEPWYGSGFAASFSIREDEKFYGLGDETRERIQKKGHRAKLWVQNVRCYAPNPYVMSNNGWALFLNTTWRNFFDVGCSKSDVMTVSAREGSLDYYIFNGKNLPKLLNTFTDIAGKPAMLPQWAYGLTFVCNQQADAKEMLDDCLNFRREGIPCDVIGLEPGWMETYYDYSTDKRWHPERFYLPEWAKISPHTFLSAAKRLGFKMSLWLCCDYDLSFYEEKQCTPETDSNKREDIPYHFSEDDFERDSNFGHGPIYMDDVTKRDEGWFEHLKQFVDQGVSAFKLDGARQVNEHPDKKWGNGMDDEEMHNLYPILLNKQMHQGFKEHTGLRPMIYSAGGYAGIQQYSATWAGDTGGGPKPLISMLNHGLSGHSNVSCDMDVFTVEGIHFGFLQAWSQICSWAYWRHPWLLGEKLLSIFKYYAKLRYSLLPYLYTMAHTANVTGMPIMRAMSLIYPEDEKSDELVNQYMLGESLLVSVFSENVHLPEGKWINYWTDESYEGGQDIIYKVPEGKGGGLFVKAGAIIPYYKEIDYVGQKPMEEIELHIYPEGISKFKLYEDDGVSLEYNNGKFAVTEFGCSYDGSTIKINIGEVQGSYKDMPEKRYYQVCIHIDKEPIIVEVNEKRISQYNYKNKILSFIYKYRQ